MGIYVNPGNCGFTDIRNDLYIDKSGLISLINDTINTPRRLTCVSRPRRFGKSFAAQMLCAYYDRTCDSDALFRDLEIAENEDYGTYLNQYDVIYLDLTGIRLYSDNYKNAASYISRQIISELKEMYPTINAEQDLPYVLADAVSVSGTKFIMIIDEWDAPIRENPEIQREYLLFLRSLFKNGAITSKVFAAAYMTGILPIKKDDSQSAISDFYEYTMLEASQFAEYVGFTEPEVRNLCAENHIDFKLMKEWYDGYHLENIDSIYNPNSVMKAVHFHHFRSFWTETSAAGSLLSFIKRDMEGLGALIIQLIGGNSVPVDVSSFSNDLVTFHNKDDVLTLLVHLGYLTYDAETTQVRIPNEELRREFSRTIRQDKRPETMKRVAESDQLILDTIHMNEAAVAAEIEKIHMENTNPLNANNENSLRAVIQLAYFSYKDYYLKMEELPTGHGYADIVYLPKQGETVPALVVELKWNQSADAAIAQIKEQKYPQVLQGYGGEILLVGIAYDKEARQKSYTCTIEKWQAPE
ncbi:MAG: AAA family ATPase [Blautia sp.]|nr:AAA family ATPase [Blautia sp.]